MLNSKQLSACMSFVLVSSATYAHISKTESQSNIQHRGMIDRVSVRSDGREANGNSGYLLLSASNDGQYIAFYSEASDLILDDTNSSSDVFIHDRLISDTQRVSVASHGVQSNGPSDGASISGDGRYIAFRSFATNLVPNDDNANADIFVHDQVLGITNRVSISSSGEESNGSNTGAPAISGDGRYVVFQTDATNLSQFDTNTTPDLFVHDRITGATTLVSTDSNENQGNGDSGYHVSISEDGRYIAFISYANNLVESDTNNTLDCFLKDMRTGSTIRVSVDSNGHQSNGDCYWPSVSKNGEYVAYTSSASNLAEGDINGFEDAFLHDTVTGKTTLVSLSWDRRPANGHSASTSISADGRHVAFMSHANNLVEQDTNSGSDVFLFSTTTSKTTRVTRSSNGSEPSGSGVHVGTSLSANGQVLAFASDSDNLVTGDNNGKKDVFVYDKSILPFLDLPIDYSGRNFSEAALGNTGSNKGRVNSWFDHTYPTYRRTPNFGTENLTRWFGAYSGEFSSDLVNCRITDQSCYDGHNGIDFQKVTASDLVFAAAPGIVTNTVVSNSGYGNRVWIDHRNGYATLYGHLRSISVTIGTVITNTRLQPLGIMGNTGASTGETGIHLHFGLYFDHDGNGWTEDEVTDPYGWIGIESDPCSTASPQQLATCIAGQYLWKHRLHSVEKIDSSGGSITSPSGQTRVDVSSSTITKSLAFELWDFPTAFGTSPGLRSTGHAAFFRTVDGILLTRPGDFYQVNSVSPLGSYSITIDYSKAELDHLDESHLAIYHWNSETSAWVALPTLVNTTQKLSMAHSTNLGHFDLQAPLLCSTDVDEPNDTYYDATVLHPDGNSKAQIIDANKDEDWFKMRASSHQRYNFFLRDVTSGLHLRVQLFDRDGVSLLAESGANASSNNAIMSWNAPDNGIFFVRVSQMGGNPSGCSVGYSIGITETTRIFLPVAQR